MSADKELPVVAYPDVPVDDTLFIAHLSAMTRHDLRSQSDIASQLAWRDTRIAELEQQLADMTADRDSWAEQASQRLADWDAMRQRAESAEQQLEQARKAMLAAQAIVQRDRHAVFESIINRATGKVDHPDDAAWLHEYDEPLRLIDAAIASRGTAQEMGK
jgi:hypothetical protein